MAQGLATAVDPLLVPPEPSSSTGAPLGAPAGARCPRCAGAVKAGAPWCTQCWLDLRPPPQPERPPVRLPVQLLETAGAGPVGVSAGTGGWPCPPCGAVNDVELDTCAACGTSLFTALRADEQPLLVLPGVGDVSRLSRGQRLGLAASVVVVVLLLVALLGLLTG